MYSWASTFNSLSVQNPLLQLQPFSVISHCVVCTHQASIHTFLFLFSKTKLTKLQINLWNNQGIWVPERELSNKDVRKLIPICSLKISLFLFFCLLLFFFYIFFLAFLNTCVLKVNRHWHSCKQKVKKLLRRIEGEYSLEQLSFFLICSILCALFSIIFAKCNLFG